MREKTGTARRRKKKKKKWTTRMKRKSCRKLAVRISPSFARSPIYLPNDHWTHTHRHTHTHTHHTNTRTHEKYDDPRFCTNNIVQHANNNNNDAEAGTEIAPPSATQKAHPHSHHPHEKECTGRVAGCNLLPDLFLCHSHLDTGKHARSRTPPSSRSWCA
mmetsp:Transcript_16677/g.45833  ORF Transcript_16677/g.45833 Transcript_16677/m.45833 type:complete len:160 (+) Transcript_16677:733-1212(+)